MQRTFMQGLRAHPPVASLMSEALNGNHHIPSVLGPLQLLHQKSLARTTCRQIYHVSNIYLNMNKYLY